jgi:hypothetical protein
MKRQKMMRCGWIVMGLLAAAAVGACGSDDDGQATTGTGGEGGTGGGEGGSGAEGGMGGSPAGNWACIGTVEAPMYGANGEVVDVNTTVHDPADAVIADATVQVCAYGDSDCTMPQSQTVTQSTGQAIVEAPLDARHYLDCSAPGYVDSLLMTNGPPVANPCDDPDAAACTCDGCSQTECNDGMGSFTDCTCPQCSDDAYCSNPDNCHDDGECNPWLEGCVCGDCADHPACGGAAGPAFVCDVSKAANQDALLVADGDFDTFFTLNGLTNDPTRGHVGIGIGDCDGELAPGVIIAADSADGETIVAYDDGSGLSMADLSESTAAGIAVVLNLPPGEVTITGTVAATGEVIATRTAVVRPGAFTLAVPMSPVPEAP